MHLQAHKRKALQSPPQSHKQPALPTARCARSDRAAPSAHLGKGRIRPRCIPRPGASPRGPDQRRAALWTPGNGRFHQPLDPRPEGVPALLDHQTGETALSPGPHRPGVCRHGLAPGLSRPGPRPREMSLSLWTPLDTKGAAPWNPSPSGASILLRWFYVR